MASEPAELTIEDLAERAGVSVRTVRYYIGQGLLAGPGARGRAAAYGVEHLARLRLIRRLAEQHVPLAEQRRRLEGLSLVEVQGLLSDQDHRDRALQRAEGALSPRDYVAELLAQARTVPGAPVASAILPPPSLSKPMMSEGSPTVEAPPVAPLAPSPAPARLRRSAAPFAATSDGMPVVEDWQKWQLAPGIELHVRGDAARTSSQLVERLLETAREAPGRDPDQDATFPPGGSTHDH